MGGGQRGQSWSFPVSIVACITVVVAAAWRARAATVFFDDFNRPDSPSVGNGWSNTTGASTNLEIKNQQVTSSVLGAANNGIFRPFGGSGPATVSATVFETSGWNGIPGAYHTAFSFRSGGNVRDGYGVRFNRSDRNYDNSVVTLFDGAKDLQTINSTVQFGPQIDIRLTARTDGSVVGRVGQGSNVFNFSFGPRSVASSGENFQYWQGGPDNRTTSPIFHRMDNLRLVSAPQTQRVVLAWGEDVPFRVVPLSVFNSPAIPIIRSGTMDAASLSGSSADLYRREVLRIARKSFVDSGLTNVEVVEGTPSPGDTVVYFADEVHSGLAGKAEKSVDRFNARSLRGETDRVVVFVNPQSPNFSLDAETVVHEAGHTFGTRHVNPGSSADPSNDEVMDVGNDSFSANPRFINAKSGVTDLGSPYTHNPAYHLRRYVEGESHNDLVAQGVQPGSWDVEHGLVRTVIDFGESNRVLYDVTLIARGNDSENATTLAHFDQITLAELSEMTFDIEEGAPLTLIASSNSDGPADVALATGDPFAAENLFLHPSESGLAAFLQIQTGSSTFGTLSSATVTGSVVPEPSTLGLFIACGVPLLGRRRRATHG